MVRNIAKLELHAGQLYKAKWCNNCFWARLYNNKSLEDKSWENNENKICTQWIWSFGLLWVTIFVGYNTQCENLVITTNLHLSCKELLTLCILHIKVCSEMVWCFSHNSIFCGHLDHLKIHSTKAIGSLQGPVQTFYGSPGDRLIDISFTKDDMFKLLNAM